MNAHTILLLGDSASMTIGMERACYAFSLASAPLWPAGTALLNGSQPGITSADACAYFFRALALGRKPSGVVVYVGNCDAMNSEVSKGRYTPTRQAFHAVRKALGWKPARTRLKNRLHHFEWDSLSDPCIEKPESPEDFEYNLERVLRRCEALSIPAVLVRPKANRHFPAGVGKGNFAFYRFQGMHDTFGATLKGRSGLAEALRLHEQGRLDEAMERYALLMDEATAADGAEYTLTLLNNYATAAAEAGRTDEAERLFLLLAREAGSRHEIARFNLARLRLAQGDTAGYETLLAEACEADRTMYRVRGPYIAAIDRLARKYPGCARIVDMHALIPDSLFVDHCHPLPEGQAILALEIARALNDAGFAGDSPAVVENALFNPELCLGNETEFYEYFRTYAPFTPEELAAHVRTVSRMAETGGPGIGAQALAGFLPREVERAFAHYLKHPCFPTLRDAALARPSIPSDVGRFPEFFLMRHLTPYLRRVEADPALSGLFEGGRGLLRTAEEMARPLPPPARERIPAEPPTMDSGQGHGYAARVLARTAQVLSAHLSTGPQVANRLKSTIYWYFRETLRFGSHSRLAMRYDRVTLEQCAEGLAVAAFHAQGEAGLLAEAARLWTLLKHTAETHERHCAGVDLARPGGLESAAYAEEMDALFRRFHEGKHKEQE